MKQILLLIIAGVVLAGCSTSYTIRMEQVGSNVVAIGSGAINLTGLTFRGSPAFPAAGVNASYGVIQTGPPGQVKPVDQYIGFTGPTSFGSGGGFFANTGGGDHVGILGFIIESSTGDFSIIEVPQGYVSGAALSDSMTFNNATLASLGVTPGTYVWTWGTEANQKFTLIIGPTK